MARNARQHNERTARSTPTTSDHNFIRDFYYYDDLDERLRFRLQEHIHTFSSEHTWESYKTVGSARTLIKLRDAELDDIMTFAAEYYRKYKEPYPHTTAFATIQRYGKKEGTRQRLTGAQVRILRRFKLMIEDNDGY